MTKFIHVINLEECKNTLETSTIFPATCESTTFCTKHPPGYSTVKPQSEQLVYSQDSWREPLNM